MEANELIKKLMIEIIAADIEIFMRACKAPSLMESLDGRTGRVYFLDGRE